jgi:hypothetical protein
VLLALNWFEGVQQRASGRLLVVAVVVLIDGLAFVAQEEGCAKSALSWNV